MGFKWPAGPLPVGAPTAAPVSTLSSIVAPEAEVLGLPSYELWITDDFGLRLAQVTTFSTLSATQVANQIGWFDLVLPPDFDTSLIAPDRMLQLWRQPAGGTLSLWRPYFIRRWRWQTRGGDEILIVCGPDVNDLLRRRIIAHFAGSSQSRKVDFADDMMKEVVTEAIADGTNPAPAAGTRVWADLSIAPDTSSGPSITKSFPWKTDLLPSAGGALALISKAAKEAGTEVFFSVEPNVVGSSSITFEFRTFINQPRQDVSDRVFFEKESGNLENPFLEFDYSLEENYIYGGGQGEGEARNIQQVSDADRFNASQWNRCEGFADARNSTADAGVEDAARSRLEEGRPTRKFGGDPIDTAGTRFGVDWDFGYKVTARYRDEEFPAIARAVVIQVDDSGTETIQTRLEHEDN